MAVSYFGLLAFVVLPVAGFGGAFLFQFVPVQVVAMAALTVGTGQVGRAHGPHGEIGAQGPRAIVVEADASRTPTDIDVTRP